MNKIPTPDKSFSFSRNRESDAVTGQQGELGEYTNHDSLHDDTLPHVSEEVDRFLCTLQSQSQSNNPPPPQLPDCIYLLPKILDSTIDKYNANRYKTKFGQDTADDTSFLEALDLLSKLSTILSHFPSNSLTSSALDKTSSVLEKAMSFLAKELCILLEDTKGNDSDRQSKTPVKITKHLSSFNSHSLQENDLGVISDNESPSATIDQKEFPAFSPETVSKMNKIVTAMIAGGYQIECCMTFSNLRRSAFKTVLQSLGYVTISMEDIQRTQWESLEGQIGTWINVLRHCSTVLFSGERRFYNSVFPNQPSVSQRLFSDLARAVIIRFLNFAEAIALTKRSVEKLFKFLDMYETLRDLERTIDESYAEEVAYEIATAKGRLGEAVVSMFFCDLENSIKSDNKKIPVPNGAVHPLTRYVMNYLEYVCEYKDTLEQVFEQGGKGIEKLSSNNNPQGQREEGKREDGMPKNSPFAVELMTVMDLLDANVEMKSKLYRDEALRYIFLMNNGRYIVKKVKGSGEIHECMGDNWCRRRQSRLRLYHKNYQRETWGKVLECLSHGGLQGSEKVLKSLVKERFKTFNAMFEEIQKTQSTWVVSDEQLRSELRVSISAVMIPAYRSFWGRFKQYIDSGKQMEKYIKYQPEDIEAFIDKLFNGNASSMARRRT